MRVRMENNCFDTATAGKKQVLFSNTQHRDSHMLPQHPAGLQINSPVEKQNQRARNGNNKNKRERNAWQQLLNPSRKKVIRQRDAKPSWLQELQPKGI